MKRGCLFGAMALLVPVAMTALPGEAGACGSLVYLDRALDRGTRPAGPSKTQLVSQAEQDLAEGRHKQAAVKVLTAFPALKIVKPGELALSDRAMRVLALASVRTEGTRYATLTWAVGALRALSVRHDNNPSYLSDLGEALAKHPRGEEEAKNILNRLADKDLLTSAEAYAALARIKAEAGDKASRDAYVKRCETMTKTPAKVCVVPEVADTATAT